MTRGSRKVSRRHGSLTAALEPVAGTGSTGNINLSATF